VRTGGVSAAPFDSLNLGGLVGDDPLAVDRNRTLLFEAAGLAASQVATVNQVHGDRVVFASAGPSRFVVSERAGGEALGGAVDADAIVAAPGVAAGVRTADCVPILLFDPASGAAAAVHAGWRGTFARIASRAVSCLVTSYGTDVAELRAAIGPAIGRCCFEVGADVASRFVEAPAFGSDVVIPAAEGQGPHVDLVLANQRLLVAAGLHSEHVDVLDRCTVCEPELFFSHRRDAGRTGRHLSFVLGRRPADVGGGAER
jgi:YfiH family protein